MTTPTNQAPKKPRRKVTTDLGRKLLTKERQRLSREQANLAQQQLQEAERRRTQQKRNVQSHKPIDVAVSRSLIRRLAGVLSSEGVNVRIVAQPTSRTTAWTDFEQIFVGYQAQDDDRVLAATIRGLTYHEGGHCRFTLPFQQLAEKAGQTVDYKLRKAWNCLEDQRMETAVVADSPRKAAYFTPMIMLNHTPNINDAAANWPLLIQRKYLPSNIRSGARKMFVSKHNLMRMDGEALARRYEACTRKYVYATDAATMWEAIVEYNELLLEALPLASNMDSASHERQYKRPQRDDLDDFLIIPIPMDGEGESEGGAESDDEIEESDTIDTLEDWQRFEEALHTLLNGGDVILAIYQPVSNGEGEGGDSGASELDPDEDETEGQGNPGGEGDEGEQGSDDDGLTYANEGESTEHQSGGTSGSHKNTGVRDDLDYKPESDDDDAAGGSDEDEADDELTDDDLADALGEAIEERDADRTLDADVQSIRDALNDRTSALLPYTAGISNDVEAKAAADNLADDIEQAFQENTVDKAPGWVEGQRRGFVNVLRYETRRPGDVEFFRAYTDTDAPGSNIAVSVLLDYSGSMCNATKELAQVGYACKAACQKLDIPATVTLWDTDATVLWDANETAEHLPVIVSAGGTNPSVALADLDNQQYGKTTHIVIVMTDGDWGGKDCYGMLASYKGDSAGRYFIGLGYNSNAWDSGEGMADNLRKYGCDEAHKIDSLMDIPRYLEQALIAFS